MSAVGPRRKITEAIFFGRYFFKTVPSIKCQGLIGVHGFGSGRMYEFQNDAIGEAGGSATRVQTLERWADEMELELAL